MNLLLFIMFQVRNQKETWKILKKRYAKATQSVYPIAWATKKQGLMVALKVTRDKVPAVAVTLLKSQKST